MEINQITKVRGKMLINKLFLGKKFLKSKKNENIY